MINTFTAEDMKDYGDYVATLDSAMLSPNFEKWCKERFEPTKKVIDLSVLIGGIDCEFSNNGNTWGVGKLAEINEPFIEEGEEPSDTPHIYMRDNTNLHTRPHRYCQPRMNHKHAWDGGNCPLPEGFMVKVYWRNYKYAPCQVMPNEVTWGHNGGHSDIIHFAVLGLADDYVMPWE